MFVVCRTREATDRSIGGDDNASLLRGWVGFWQWNINSSSLTGGAEGISRGVVDRSMSLRDLASFMQQD